MTIIESIQAFISNCPYINEFTKVINIDNLPENISFYSIESISASPIIEKYINGDSIRQYVFTFSSKESYGQDIIQKLQNSGFYEYFSDWLEEQTIKGNLPVLSEGKESRIIETITTEYAFITEIDKAKYQIQCRLIYFKEGGI
jgi:hypothetical protein